MTTQEHTMNSWWRLSDETKAELKPEATDKHTIDAFYLDEMSWAFHLPQYQTFNELLTNGTEIVLSDWYERLSGEEAGEGSQLRMEISTYPPEDFDTSITFIADDPEDETASYYRDQTTAMKVWLCGYLPWLFGSKPQQLWIKFHLID